MYKRAYTEKCDTSVPRGFYSGFAKSRRDVQKVREQGAMTKEDYLLRCGSRKGSRRAYLRSRCSPGPRSLPTGSFAIQTCPASLTKKRIHSSQGASPFSLHPLFYTVITIRRSFYSRLSTTRRFREVSPQNVYEFFTPDEFFFFRILLHLLENDVFFSCCIV